MQALEFRAVAICIASEESAAGIVDVVDPYEIVSDVSNAVEYAAFTLTFFEPLVIPPVVVNLYLRTVFVNGY